MSRKTPIDVDGLGYEFRALAVAHGHGFVNPLPQALFRQSTTVPDALNPPAWVTVLAVAIKLGLRTVLSHQLVAACIGTTTIVVTGIAGRKAFGPQTGLIAAALAAVYPNTWLYEREMLSEPLVFLGVAICLYLVYSFRAFPRVVGAVALGVAVAVLALSRSEEILVFPFVVLPLVLSANAQWRRRFTFLASAGLAFGLVLAPWTLYNASRFARPVVLSTGLGQAMKDGNCGDTYYGPLLGYYKVGFGEGCNLGVARLSSDQSIADDQLRSAALGYMRAHSSRVPVVVAARIGRTFNVFRPFQQVHLEGERKTNTWVLWAALFSYWLLILPAIFGVIVARRRKIPIYPLLAFPVIVSISVAFTIGAVRYRAAAEIPLVLLAAFGIHAATDRSDRPEKDRSTMFGRSS